ncbi:IS3 family transposase [Caballeronia sp. GACF4]|uniref:IS3 family transposase n=1 Tax=Caballeronia sp. GACF4 TaxID=2921763 RepID=UPI0032F0774B
MGRLCLCPDVGRRLCAACLCRSTDQFIEAVDSYIRWYNEKRIKISLDALSPIEYRASLGLTI